MVKQLNQTVLKPNSEFLEGNKNDFVRKNYTIEKRVFQDMFFFKGWFRNMVPKWSSWIPAFSYTRLDIAESQLELLESKKPYCACRTEYRMIKEKNIEK